MPQYYKINFLIELPEEDLGVYYFCKTFSEWIDNPLVKAFCFIKGVT
jgi:hypothetical protein